MSSLQSTPTRATQSHAIDQEPCVSEAAMEFLLTETLHYIESTCTSEKEEEAIYAAELAAAKLERMGYSVGYRLCERLAQDKTFGTDSHLEAVKFLCKEFWTQVFRKQIDKLQTNHRGVFVLKDFELVWLTRLAPNQEKARVGAIQLLAFPCGLVRGALANLGIPAVVSCDFLADGQHMAACSFNIKVK